MQLINFVEAMEEILKIGSWMLLASVKYFFAVPVILTQSTWPWYIDALIASSGASIGVLAFTYLGAYIAPFFSRIPLFKMTFSKLKRIIHIKNKYGLIGIAFLSPILLSIPLGCIVSASFETDKRKIITYQLASVILWSLIIFGAKGLFKIEPDQILPFNG